MSGGSSLLRLRPCSILALAPLVAALCLPATALAVPQRPLPHDELHGVISRRELTPPLRSGALSVRYSPDGLYLMVQDPGGIFIFSRNPLRLNGFAAADSTYPATFSFDSKSITSIGDGLRMTRATLPPGGPKEEKDLPARSGCLQGLLSPGAEFFACLAPDFQLAVYELATLRTVFSKSLAIPNSRYPIVFIPLDPGTAFSGPFGFRLANNWDGMIGKGAKYVSMSFSADGKKLFASGAADSFCVELASGQKCSFPGSIKKRKFASFSVLPDDRVLLAGAEREDRPAVLSLKDGSELAAPSFSADSAHLASNPRYALLENGSAIGRRVFDLDQNREVDAPRNLAVDISGQETAAVDERGNLFLYRVGERLPFLSSFLPLDNIHQLRAAAVTPDLDFIAFAVDGSGAVFSLATGQRVYSGPGFSAATFSDPLAAYLVSSSIRKVPTHVLRIDLPSAGSATAWSVGAGLHRSSGSSLFEYSFVDPMGRGIPVVRMNESDVPYVLRGLDLRTGNELWKRDFSRDCPVPFADPQGEHLVLAWNARTEGAQNAAKRAGPAAAQVYRQAKLAKQDSFFEVLDARSGKTLGGILVQEGNGPYSFDAAFSAGNSLFLFKDGKRVFLYSLVSGEPIARFTGGIPAVNSQSQLFATDERPRVLGIYDLASGAKLDEQVFPDSLAYTHFSADGNRLLALTVHQMAYILDVSAVRTSEKTLEPPPPN